MKKDPVSHKGERIPGPLDPSKVPRELVATIQIEVWAGGKWVATCLTPGITRMQVLDYLEHLPDMIKAKAIVLQRLLGGGSGEGGGG